MVRDDLAGKVRAALAEAAETRPRSRLEGIRSGQRRASPRDRPSRRTAHCQRRAALPRPLRGGRPTAWPRRSRRARIRARAATEVGEVQRLRDELTSTRERLEAVISDKEAVNEELRAANEEMLSGGEEMQSVNEELETTHEELQSTNEELRARNDELGQVGNDLTNLLPA